MTWRRRPQSIAYNARIIIISTLCATFTCLTRPYLMLGRVQLHSKLRIVFVFILVVSRHGSRGRLAVGRCFGGSGRLGVDAVLVAVFVVTGDIDVVSVDESSGGVAQLASHHPSLFLGELELLSQVGLAFQALLEVASQLLQLMRERGF